MPSFRSKAVTITAIGAAALGGAALANAAGSGSSSTNSTAAAPAAPYGGQNRPGPPPGGPRDPSKGGHMKGGKTETLLTGDTAAKVKSAAEAKVSGATVERVETDVDTGSPYEAHVRKADGSEVVVYVNKAFTVTGTEAHGPR